MCVLQMMEHILMAAGLVAVSELSHKFMHGGIILIILRVMA